MTTTAYRLSLANVQALGTLLQRMETETPKSSPEAIERIKARLIEAHKALEACEVES